MDFEQKVIAETGDTEVVLRDGQRLRVRPIRLDDKQRLKDLFYKLSPLTRYFRFQYIKTHISDEELKYARVREGTGGNSFLTRSSDFR